MKIFVINLPKDIERLHSIDGQLRNLQLDYDVIEAVYGKNLSDSDLHQLTTEFGRERLSLSEIGCSLSHLKAYQTIVNSQLPFALILEDDAQLSADVVPVVQALSEHLDPQRADVVLLSVAWHYRGFFYTNLTEKHRLAQVFHASLTHGYVITHAAAKQFLKALRPVELEADAWQVMSARAKVNIRAVIPYCIGLSECAYQDTNITRQDRSSERNKKLYREGQPLYKKWYWSLLKKLNLYQRQNSTW